jgi:hypothetical protein
MKRDQIRTQLTENALDFLQSPNVAYRFDGHRKVTKNDGWSALAPQRIDKWPGASCEYCDCVALGLGRGCKVFDVDLDPTDRIRSGHDIGDLHLSL